MGAGSKECRTGAKAICDLGTFCIIAKNQTLIFLVASKDFGNICSPKLSSLRAFGTLQNPTRTQTGGVPCTCQVSSSNTKSAGSLIKANLKFKAGKNNTVIQPQTLLGRVVAVRCLDYR